MTNGFFRGGFCAAVLALAAAAFGAAPTEVAVRLHVDQREYVEGERLRATIDVENSGSDALVVTNAPWGDRLFVELTRASDGYHYVMNESKPFTAAFVLQPSEGQRLETFIGDHYTVSESTRYFAKAVLVHRQTRYESSIKSFDVVPGVKVTSGMQVFKQPQGRKRTFELVFWNRDRVEHLFLKSSDENGRRWVTSDLGAVLRVTQPQISIRPNGEVIVTHRATQDEFVRTVFWSLPEEFLFREHEAMADPDVAGAKRVKELYMESGGVTPVKKPWWKFW